MGTQLCVMLCTLLMGVRAYSAQQFARMQESPRVPEHLAHPDGFIFKQGSGYRKLPIPKPIATQEWDHYSDFLKLSGSQRKALAEPYDLYRQRDWAYRLTSTQPLWDRSAELYAQRPTQPTPESTAALVELFQAADRTWPAIAAIETAFFAQVSTVLAEPQLGRLDALRLHRERARARGLSSTFPGFHFDLEPVMFAIEGSGGDMTPRDREAFETLMQAWRSSATALYARHLQERQEAHVKSGPTRALQYEAERQGLLDVGLQKRTEFRRLREPATRTARRILDVHRHYVSCIADQLPDSTGEELRRQFGEAAFKPLHPDVCDLSSVFEATESLKLAGDARDAVNALHAGWRAESMAARERMIDEYLDWHETICTNSGYDQDEYARYSKAMSATFEGRLRASELALENLTELLDGKLRGEVGKQARAWRAQLDVFRTKRAAIERRFKGWPAPNE